MKYVTLEDILLTISKWKTEAGSPYNDGWTSNSYKEMIEKVAAECEPVTSSKQKTKATQTQDRQSDAGSLFF